MKTTSNLLTTLAIFAITLTKTFAENPINVVCNPSENGHLTPDEEIELEIHYDEKKTGESPEFLDANLVLESEEISVRTEAQEVTE